VAGDAALYFDPRSLGSIVETLRQLLSDADLRAELGRRGRDRAARFSWDRVALETKAVYDAVMDAD
jgi:glycosyltransferase involved in cell wall biosynthesis